MTPQRRPGWAVTVRAGGITAALGCVLALVGMLGGPFGFVSVGVIVLVIGVVLALGGLIYRVARG